MRALTWQGNEDVKVTDVPDPRIQEPAGVIIKVTPAAICGSDLHLYGVLGTRSMAAHHSPLEQAPMATGCSGTRQAAASRSAQR
jgi:threonine dehydrogenase-like Zn-dependent dehydrogenase